MPQFPNLDTYFANKHFDPSNWKTFPIILRWMQSGTMDTALQIIDQKVRYLLAQNARRKIEEWFSDDKHIIQTTAERYILDYLQSKNSGYEENFVGNGVDAYLNKENERIGIEVTTVNKTITEAMFIERLLMFLHTMRYEVNERIEVSCPISVLLPLDFYVYDLIERVGNAIIQNVSTVQGVSISKSQVPIDGYISWNITGDTGFNLLSFLDTNLSNVINSKRRQLSANRKNILFVGVNELPIDYLNPEIFREASNPGRFAQEIQTLENIVVQNLVNTPNILGVCYFIYDIRQEFPFYPLRIFWRDTNNKVQINL